MDELKIPNIINYKLEIHRNTLQASVTQSVFHTFHGIPRQLATTFEKSKNLYRFFNFSIFDFAFFLNCRGFFIFQNLLKTSTGFFYFSNLKKTFTKNL